MAYALVDNATLTAVQRLTGEAKARSHDSTDGDIVALENLVQAILFYDDLVIVDNYKDEFRERRKRNFDFIRFIDPVELNLNQIEELAKNEATTLIPTIRGGEFAGADFKGFLEILKVHMICTWDVSSSVYYLTMKLLGQPRGPEFDKYGNLSASIFAELVDSEHTATDMDSTVRLVDSRGRPIADPTNYVIPGARSGDGKAGGVTDALQAFVAALSWLSFKTLYYIHTARHLHADTFLYPMRQAFQINYMKRKGAYGYDFTKSVIERMSNSLSKDVQRIVSSDRTVAAPVDLPMFSAWLVMESGHVGKVVESALQLRNDKRIVVAREQLREIRNHFDSHDLASANKKITKLVTDLDKVSAQLISSFGLKSNSGIAVTRLMQVYNTLAAFQGWPNLPEFDLRAKLPKLIAEQIPRNGFAALYRDIGRDLAQVWTLGEARDRLGAEVRIDRTKAVYNPKVENPQYRRAHSWWKSPM